MDLGPRASLLVRSIFTKSSSLLICAPSRSGKSSFVHTILKNKKLYFGSNRFEQVLIISCNPRIDILLPEVKDSSVQGCYIEEFDLNQVEEGTCLIFDDVSSFNSKIGEALNVALHHMNLPFVAVIVHSILGSDLFRYTSICHRALFFLGSTSSARSASFLISRFFRDKLTRVYLEGVLAYVQKSKSNLLICLNKGADEEEAYLALSHLEKLTSGYCLAYPETSFEWPEGVLEEMAIDPSLARKFDLETLPPHTLVLAPADLVLRAKRELPAEGEEKHSCTKLWNKGVQELERAIEGYFKLAQWSRCKNIVREILKNSQFCLDPETLSVYLKKSHKQRVNLIDFLAFAIRPVGPGEKIKAEFALYKKLAQTLLAKGSPKSLFKNKFLL